LRLLCATHGWVRCPFHIRRDGACESKGHPPARNRSSNTRVDQTTDQERLLRGPTQVPAPRQRREVWSARSSVPSGECRKKEVLSIRIRCVVWYGMDFGTDSLVAQVRAHPTRRHTSNAALESAVKPTSRRLTDFTTKATKCATSSWRWPDERHLLLSSRRGAPSPPPVPTFDAARLASSGCPVPWRRSRTAG